MSIDPSIALGFVDEVPSFLACFLRLWMCESLISTIDSKVIYNPNRLLGGEVQGIR